MQRVNQDAVVDKVQDYKGHVIAAKSLAKLRSVESVAEEALVDLHALEFGREFGFSKDYYGR